MDYSSKYLKYKNKYLELKELLDKQQLIGGGKGDTVKPSYYEREIPKLPHEIMKVILDNPTIEQLLRYKSNNLELTNKEQIEIRRLINFHILELFESDGIMLQDMITIIKFKLETKDETEFRALMITRYRNLLVRLSPNDLIKALQDEEFIKVFRADLEKLIDKYISEVNLPYLFKLYSIGIHQGQIRSLLLGKTSSGKTNLENGELSDIIDLYRYVLPLASQPSPFRDTIKLIIKIKIRGISNVYDIFKVYDIFGIDGGYLDEIVDFYFSRIPKIPADNPHPTGTTIIDKIVYMKMYLLLQKLFIFRRRIGPDGTRIIDTSNNYAIIIKNKNKLSFSKLNYTIRIVSDATRELSPFIYNNRTISVLENNNNVLSHLSLDRAHDNFENILDLCNHLYTQMITDEDERKLFKLDISFIQYEINPANGEMIKLAEITI